MTFFVCLVQVILWEKYSFIYMVIKSHSKFAFSVFKLSD